MEYKEHEVTWTSEKISRFWDYFSKTPTHIKQFFGYQAGGAVAKEINKQIKFQNLERILDFSCGRGDIIGHCIGYLKGNQEIYGSDFSQKNTNTTNLKLKNKSTFKGAIHLTSLPSPFNDNFFDLVILTEVIEHLSEEELEQTLIEAGRILRNDGYIFITTPNNEDLDKKKIICPDCGCIFHSIQHVTSWNESKLRMKMENYNFKTKYSKPVTWKWRFIRRFLFFKPMPRLLYIGQK